MLIYLWTLVLEFTVYHVTSHGRIFEAVTKRSPFMLFWHIATLTTVEVLISLKKSGSTGRDGQRNIFKQTKTSKMSRHTLKKLLLKSIWLFPSSKIVCGMASISGSIEIFPHILKAIEVLFEYHRSVVPIWWAVRPIRSLSTL